MLESYLILIVSGLFSGLLAGILGVGGGTVLVPLLVALNYTPLQAVATSSLAIVVTASAGTVQNWRMGYLNWRRVIFLGIPAVITAQLGVLVANYIPDFVLLTAFGVLLIFNIFLGYWRRRLLSSGRSISFRNVSVQLAAMLTGGIGGFLAGLFGIGGGVIMVPLQILLLHETIKVAIQTSLGVIVITSISSCLGHALRGNVLFIVGLILGLGGLIGVQISTRFLPKLPDKVIQFCFYGMLAILAVYTFWQAGNAYQSTLIN